MSQVQEVKQATDIIQLISERFPLQRSGTSWRGLCPFHSEKSPSFFVSEQLQRYKCFGCNESGDALTFLQKYDGLTFAEALRTLADRAGIQLKEYRFTAEDDQRQRVLEILDLAKAYYHYVLQETPAGALARAYLQERGTTADSIKLFQIGFALPSWDGLLNYLHNKKKYELADIAAAGLTVTSQNSRTYDRFRDRIMFPLTDHRGRVVGFSGRVLTKDTKEAKYINTSETMVYHKSEMLFGFSQLYQSIRKANEVVVVEGEFDVISSAQAHVNNVVAVKGSVLTEKHMRLLSRTVATVLLSFDMDSAGIAATKRAIEVARPFALELRVIRLPEALHTKDPDELARTQPEIWREAVKSAISVYEFFLQAALKTYDANTPEGKRRIIDEIAPIFGQISHAVEAEFYTQKLAMALATPLNVVKTDLLRFQQGKKSGLGKSANSSAGGSSGSVGGATGSNSSGSSAANKPDMPLSKQANLEYYALFLLLNAKPETMLAKAEKLKHLHFQTPGAKQLVQAILTAPQPFVFPNLVKTLGEDLQALAAEVSLAQKYLINLPNLDLEKEWQKAVSELIDLDIAEEIRTLNKEMEDLENRPEKTAADDAKQAELLRKIAQLLSRQKISA